METENAITRAIKAAGGTTAFAVAMGETPQTVSNWIARGQPPANKCAAIQKLTGVDRRDLRPNDWRDYWPELDKAA